VAALDFAAFLELSLRLLARQAPECYARLARVGDAVRFAVEGEPVRLRFESGRHRIDRQGAAALEVRSDRGTIGALAAGELSLLDAILTERFGLRGTADAAARFDAALLAFVDGAVRYPSFPALFDAFRRERPAQAAARFSL